MKSKAILNSIGFASALATMATTAMAREGGYNGPDLNPVSIPVQLDRGISYAAITDAMAVCMLKGDATEGLQSVAQKLATQMGAEVMLDSWTLISPDFQRDHMVGIIQFGTFLRFTDVLVGHVDGQFDVNQMVAPAETPGTMPHSKLTFSFGSGPHSGLSLTSSDNGVTFPMITYDKVLNDGTFDDFGNLIQSTKLVSGLKIQASVPAGVPITQIPLINSQTQAPSKFTVNGAEYIQCLQAELQKRAKSSASR